MARLRGSATAGRCSSTQTAKAAARASASGPWTRTEDTGKPDGSPRLFQKYFPSVHSRFSPDGKWLAFASRLAWLNDEGPLSNGESQPYGEIFVAPVDGTSEPIRLTHNKWEDSVPCWGVMPPAAAAAPAGRQ